MTYNPCCKIYKLLKKSKKIPLFRGNSQDISLGRKETITIFAVDTDISTTVAPVVTLRDKGVISHGEVFNNRKIRYTIPASELPLKGIFFVDFYYPGDDLYDSVTIENIAQFRVS